MAVAIRADRVRRTLLVTALALEVVAALWPAISRADRALEPEETISELLREPTVEQQAEKEQVEQALAETEEAPEETRWAALPQLGFGPETGFLFGLKLTDRDFLSSGATFDVDGTYALEGQQYLAVALASPRMFGRDIPFLVRASFDVDPRRRFFGLGNNRQGPDPASSHLIQAFGGDVTVGWRLIEDLSLNFQVGGWRTDIRNGDRVDGSPPTPLRFPDLPGIDGGVLIPFAVSLVYDERRDQTRPTRGWRVIAKASHVNSDLGSDFDFSRFIGDAGYLHPFFDGDLVLGARVGGGALVGSFDDMAFWDLSVIGGEDTLRGFFPYRFLGTSRVWTNVEARGRLFAFDIFDWWEVQVDGVGFFDAGRVFIDQKDLERQGGDEGGLETTDRVQLSYGAGLRLAFSDAIAVRLDAGFSAEETGLIYLTFGHTF
jgi:outer membrane protein assembly factor BamA